MEMETDTVEEKLEVEMEVGVGQGKKMERKLTIPFSSLDDLNTLVGTFDG